MRVLSRASLEAFMFILVYLLRIASPLLIFKFPLFTVLFATFLDIIDGETASNVLTKEQYQQMDKALDFWWLTIVMVWSFLNLPDYKWMFLGFYVYRLIGVILFKKTSNRLFIFLFPNVFETLFFLFFAAYIYPAFEPVLLNNLIWWFAFVVVFKFAHEYWLHVAKKSIVEDVFKLKRKWTS